ncbi:Ig-like domain-containing protein [Clostridium massiliodielmoense]|uniref:Ig-like domain-containing protein n=1 Tax=Clostridium massiliodielmoense TaxID=1776385 RepID=UPI0004D7A71E|nr:Ig-like domain-containing protein [Clostridium massiliodielmoense]KEH99398.1 hypothetical protein Z962_00380 [Clostridium botulinum C/D str. BKT12695]NEZ48705.1 hypothetical protein [Clostridium botulinum]
MKKRALILLLVTMLLGISGCNNNKQKTSVLTNDVKKEATMQENELKKVIADGAKLLDEEKWEDAKSTFEKAISMDKSSKETYIDIKNRYMEKNRLDDAYYIIKLAVNNNVDTENMKKLLNDIKSKFEVTRLDVQLNKDSSYNLPTKILAKINNKEEKVDVTWQDKTINTNKVGTKVYKGKIDNYDREVQLNITIVKPKEVSKDIQKIKRTGGVSKVYESGGKRYLKFDEVEFYLNKGPEDNTAEIEAKKDGRYDLMPDNRVHDDYYIRNKDKSLKTYEVSPNAEIYVCGYTINKDDVRKYKISYDKFKTMDMGDRVQYKGILCHIYLENNVVVKIQQQYVP